MELQVNLSDPAKKAETLDLIRGMDGPRRIEIVRPRSRKNDSLRRFYFPFVVQPIGDYFRAKSRDVSDEQVHHMLMLKFFHELVPHPDTGEVIGVILPSCNDLTREQLHDLIAKASAWATKTLGIKIAAASAAA